LQCNPVNSCGQVMFSSVYELTGKPTDTAFSVFTKPCDLHADFKTIAVQNEDPNRMTYQWNWQDSSANERSFISRAYKTPGIRSVKLLITDKNGCTNSASRFFRLTAPLIIDIKQMDGGNIIYTTHDERSYEAVSNYTFGTINFSWTGENFYSPTPLALISTDGIYTVKAQDPVTGCSDTATVRVELIRVPNIFTPNHDGVNDLFGFRLRNGMQAVIFDRWGKQVYQSSGEGGYIAWDGKSQEGRDCSDGTFFYIILPSPNNEIVYPATGVVTLLR